MGRSATTFGRPGPKLAQSEPKLGGGRAKFSRSAPSDMAARWHTPTGAPQGRPQGNTSASWAPPFTQPPASWRGAQKRTSPPAGSPETLLRNVLWVSAGWATGAATRPQPTLRPSCASSSHSRVVAKRNCSPNPARKRQRAHAPLVGTIGRRACRITRGGPRRATSCPFNDSGARRYDRSGARSRAHRPTFAPQRHLDAQRAARVSAFFVSTCMPPNGRCMSERSQSKMGGCLSDVHGRLDVRSAACSPPNMGAPAPGLNDAPSNQPRLWPRS